MYVFRTGVLKVKSGIILISQSHSLGPSLGQGLLSHKQTFIFIWLDLSFLNQLVYLYWGLA